jgi:hypothetical protein
MAIGSIKTSSPRAAGLLIHIVLVDFGQNAHYAYYTILTPLGQAVLHKLFFFFSVVFVG